MSCNAATQKTLCTLKILKKINFVKNKFGLTILN